METPRVELDARSVGGFVGVRAFGGGFQGDEVVGWGDGDSLPACLCESTGHGAETGAGSRTVVVLSSGVCREAIVQRESWGGEGRGGKGREAIRPTWSESEKGRPTVAMAEPSRLLGLRRIPV